MEKSTYLVKQKKGKIVPVNKQTKPCPACGFNMTAVKYKKGGYYKRSKKYWECSETLCNHKELEEGHREKEIRLGVYDDIIGILPLTNTNNI